jgi:hypothetical protein
MNLRYILMLLPFLLFACAQTGPTTTAGADEACVLACVKGGGLYSPCSCLCDPLCERTASAELPLTPTLQARYILADDNAPGTATACNDANNGDWCKCGSDYTNAAASCVEIGATMFLEYEAPGAPVACGCRVCGGVCRPHPPSHLPHPPWRRGRRRGAELCRSEQESTPQTPLPRLRAL